MSILGKAARFVKDKGGDVLNMAAKGSTFGLVSFKGEENFSDEVKAVRSDIKVLGEHVATKADVQMLVENQLAIKEQLDQIQKSMFEMETFQRLNADPIVGTREHLNPRDGNPFVVSGERDD